ncbi:MAG: tetratricopeptide repeat protein [Bacteroidota bacterium]
MRRLVFFLILAVALSSSKAQGYDAMYKDMQKSLVSINGSQVIGYGFFVEKNLVVASYTEVSAYTYATISFLQHEKTYTVNGYVAADPENDLVLLEVVCDSGAALKFSADTALAGMKILFVDPEPSAISKIMESTVEAVKDYGLKKVIKAKGGVLLQNAGMPALNQRGEVLGMSIKSPMNEMDINYAAPEAAIRKLILQKSTLKKLEMLKPTFDHIGNQNQAAGTEKNQEVVELLDQGNARLGQKDYKAAVDKFSQALRISPNDADAYVFRGQAKYLQMEYKDAIADFNKAIDIQPDYAEAFDLRGIAKAELGDKAGACEDWQKSFELGFNPAFKLLKEFCDVEKMK